MASNKDLRPLSREQRLQWMQIAAMITLVPQALDTQLKRDAEINSFEYGVLAAIEDAPNRQIQMSALAKWSHGSISRLSHAVSRLAKQGLVERLASPDGGRRTDVKLTKAGQNILNEVTPAHSNEVRRLIADSLSADELQNLASAARKIVENIDPQLMASLQVRLDL